jgi:tetratricopeptide (TPR) repeat protein
LEEAARREYSAAVSDYRTAANLYRGLGPQFEAHLAITLFNMGEAQCGAGNLRDSESTLRESLDLSRRALGPKHVRTVSDLNALGHIQLLLGDFSGAESRFAEALGAARELPAPNMQLAYSLAGYSSLRLRTGRPEEALPFADEALQVAVAADPREGTETALMYQNVGQIHRAAGHSERALPLLRKAVAIYERSGLVNSPRYATALSQEGLALMDEHKFAQANADMQRAISMLEGVTGSGFELAIARNNLGLLRFRQKKYTEADELLRQALKEEEYYSPANAEQIGITRDALLRLRTSAR